MRVSDEHYRTVWREGNSIFMIDQKRLPFDFEIYEAQTYSDTCDAIKNMIVRGAGAIGATAGYAMTQAFLEAPKKGFEEYIEQAKKKIENTRPTAQNLFYATKRVFDKATKESKDPIIGAVLGAEEIADEDAEKCEAIGEKGLVLIKDDYRIMTHCNAGWLAFVDWGSALSPIYKAQRSGKDIFVFVSSTEPRGQGRRLTAWELRNEGVKHKIVPDNACAYIMSKGDVDIIIVGADRIARNGDTANKIGTLDKAIAAEKYGIPFYVAAPTTTIDRECSSGKDIPIEERSENEVLYENGMTEDYEEEKVLICSPGSGAINYAFDVTPAELITGIITEKGIIKPTEEMILKLFSV